MPSRRRAAPRTGALVAFFVVSAALHAGVLLVAGALGGGASHATKRAEPRLDEVDERERAPRCELEAALTAAAGGARCLLPWAPEACGRRVWRDLRLELIQCRGLRGPERFLEPSDTKLALLDPGDIASLETVPIAEIIEPEPEPPPLPDPGAQVVEITEPSEAERPERARYLAEFDSVVERETVARGTTDEMAERPSPHAEGGDAAERGAPEESPLERDDPGEAGDPGEPGQELAMRDPEPGRRGELGGFEPRRDRVEPAPPGEPGAGGQGGSGAPDLRPSEELLARVVGSSGGSVDRLEGVAEGERTALNAVQWKHASFFNRVKREVAQDWNPAAVYRRHDPEGTVYGLRERITVVRVWLTPDGSLARIVVLRKSGIDALDEEAVRAFRAAQPFPNPPAALVDPESQTLAFNFGFHFQIGGAGDRWRIFRAR
jgi:TonB family protein